MRMCVWARLHALIRKSETQVTNKKYFGCGGKSSIMALPVVYRTVDSVLKVFRDDEFKEFGPVVSLLKIHDTVSQENVTNSSTENRGNKYPLIILEGLDGSGKSTMAKKVNNKIGGTKWCTPPEIIKPLRDEFDDHPTLRTAYYALGNYIAAMQIATMLRTTPVVMDRYWHSTAAYAAAQHIVDNNNEVELPPGSDSYYEWPEDLLKPDAVFFLQVSEHLRQQRHSKRNTTNTKQEQLLSNDPCFRENVTQAYKNMKNPGIEIIDNYRIKQTVEEMLEKIRNIYHERELPVNF